MQPLRYACSDSRKPGPPRCSPLYVARRDESGARYTSIRRVRPDRWTNGRHRSVRAGCRSPTQVRAASGWPSGQRRADARRALGFRTARAPACRALGLRSCLPDVGGSPERPERGREFKMVASDRALLDHQCATQAPLGADEFTAACVDGSKVSERDRDFVVLSTEGALEDEQRGFEQCRGLVVTARGVEDRGQRRAVRGRYRDARRRARLRGSSRPGGRRLPRRKVARRRARGRRCCGAPWRARGLPGTQPRRRTRHTHARTIRLLHGSLPCT